jgi:hypothetical protein
VVLEGALLLKGSVVMWWSIMGVAVCLWWEVYQRACKRMVREGIGAPFRGTKVGGEGVRAGEDLA